MKNWLKFIPNKDVNWSLRIRFLLISNIISIIKNNVKKTNKNNSRKYL